MQQPVTNMLAAKSTLSDEELYCPLLYERLSDELKHYTHGEIDLVKDHGELVTTAIYSIKVWCPLHKHHIIDFWDYKKNREN